MTHTASPIATAVATAHGEAHALRDLHARMAAANAAFVIMHDTFRHCGLDDIVTASGDHCDPWAD